MVPCIRGADSLDFAGFHTYYEDLISKTRENKLTADDFQGTNITLTNPGGIGTVASVPRLMSGQGTIVAVGSIAYPVEWAHAPAEKLKALGVSKVTTMTSTYDHRIIQGAESGSFLRRIDQFLQGEDDFYETVAHDLAISDRVVSNAHPGRGIRPAAARHRRRRLGQRRRRGRARPRAAPGGPGGDLAPQGLPDPRPPGGARQPARRGRAEGRPRARAGEPQPDARSSCRGSPRRSFGSASRARRSSTRCRGCATPTAARSRTRSSTSPRTSSGCGCAR